MSIVNNLFRCFTFSRRNFMNCYRSLVLPILEYCSELFGPLSKSDINFLESVQRKFTKRLLPDLPYKERLKQLSLKTLWTRRLLKDLCITHKYIYGFVWSDNIFKLADSQSRSFSLRGNGLKLQCPIESDVKYNFITNRVFNHWNMLPSSVVCFDHCSAFQTRLEAWYKSNVSLLESLDPTCLT